MKKKTWISRELDAAGIKAQYDEHVKRILGSRQVLARILKGTIHEYAPYSVEEITFWIEPDIEIASAALHPGQKKIDDRAINGENTESSIPGEGRVTYDIRFKAFLPVRGSQRPRGNKSRIKLLLNVEAQKKFYQKYRIVTRGIFYGARMLSEQLDREFQHSEYSKLKKVHTIFICMNAPRHIGNAMAEYRITKQDIIGNIPELRRNYDKLSVIIICLNEKLKQGTEGTLHGFLNTLLSPGMDITEKKDSLARDYGMKMEEKLGEELNEMCNLSEAIEEKAIKTGMKTGMKNGMKKGMKMGVEKGILLVKKARRLSAEGMSEPEIAKSCGLTAEKVHELLVD